jgi:antitoxin ParD1/3/4
MATLNVSLPEELKKIVDQRVAGGQFASHSEYVRSLIRRDQKRIDRDQLEAKLLERLQSDKSLEMTDSDFDRIRTRLKSHLTRSKKAKR